jgi:ketosteroid isomerase-like protein
MLVRYAPDVEVEFDPDFEALDLGGTFRGHDGLLKLLRNFSDAWERWDPLPAAVLDMGDRFIVLGHLRLPGNVSGLELDSEFAQLLTVRDGLCAREQEFMSWDKALRAAGLDPDAIALPARGQTSKAASGAEA